MGKLLTGLALLVLIGTMAATLAGCGPKDDSDGPQCAGNKHVQICAPATSR